MGTVARLHACLYTISSSAWRIFRVFNLLSVARCPHLPAAARHVAWYWQLHSQVAGCHSTFFIFRTTDIGLASFVGLNALPAEMDKGTFSTMVDRQNGNIISPVADTMTKPQRILLLDRCVKKQAVHLTPFTTAALSRPGIIKTVYTRFN